MYQLLARFDVRLDKDETDSVGDLRYSWRKLLQTSNEVNSSLAELQTGFKRELVANVKQFVLDVQHFRSSSVTAPTRPFASTSRPSRRRRRRGVARSRLWGPSRRRPERSG